MPKFVYNSIYIFIVKPQATQYSNTRLVTNMVVKKKEVSDVVLIFVDV